MPEPSPVLYGEAMADVLAELLNLLALERIEENLFRGQSQDLGWGRVYGGQVLGQALSAAEQTVDGDRVVHSLHAYFLRPGDVSAPIVYQVDPIRNGRSFSTRRVVAVQHGKAIFNMSASFQTPEVGFEHADAPPPGVPAPEEVLNERQLGEKYKDAMPAGIRARLGLRKPIEIRPVDPVNLLQPAARAPDRAAWFRAAGALPDDPRVHQYLLGYASDFHFLTTALQPHAITWMTKGIQMASLDHAMWFHRPFRFDDWLLYVVRSPSASGGRGLVRGQFFTRGGVLVASTIQEGLIRDRRG